MKKVLILIIILLSCVLGFIIFSYNKKVTFSVPSFDKNATSIPETIDNEYYTKLNVAEGYSMGVSGIILVNSENEGYVNLTSDDDNIVYIKLRLVDKNDNVIGESGLIKPGEYLEKIKLRKKVNEKDKFTLKIMSYEPDTYYSMSTAKLSVSLKVMENE